MSCDQMRQDCKDAFEVLHDRIDKRDRKLEEYGGRLTAHDKEITENTVNIANLAKSMSALTKALWGIASAIIIAALTAAITMIR